MQALKVAPGQEQSTYLFMTEGSSDKEYHAHLREVAGGWCAYYANGPRGRVCNTKPIKDGVFAYEVALGHFQAKVKDKIKSGYTPSESGVRFTNTEKSGNASTHVQQLPTATNESAAISMVADARFCAQEKANGERRTIEVIDGVVRGINKLGLYVNLPENLIQALAGFKNAMFDGEEIGVTFHVFDLLSYDRVNLRDRAFGERYAMLTEEVLHGLFTTPDWPIKVLTAAFTCEEKAALLAQVKDSNGEGLVFKDVTAPYGGGRSSSVFKYKFKESCTCTVIQANQQRSVQLGLLNGAGEMLAVGNVTIPANFAVPAAGELVEVEYLYFNPEGAFEQPVYLGPRNDILASEANLGQINRLKPGVSMDDLGRRIQA